MSRTLGSTVSYAWDQNSALPVILKDSTGARYVYGIDLISRTDSGGAQQYFLTDGLGSTTGLTNGTGAVTDTYQYDVFGAVRARTGTSANEFTFTGEQTDGTGLQYLRARYYDGTTGRFLSTDPIEAASLYGYVGNNPATKIDPLGLQEDEPEPIPLPVPGSTEELRKCSDDYELCIDMAGDEALYRNEIRRLRNPRAKYLAEQLFYDECDFVQLNCMKDATDGLGKFDFNDVQRRWDRIGVRNPSPRFRIQLPGSGDGSAADLMNGPSKEGRAFCGPQVRW